MWRIYLVASAIVALVVVSAGLAVVGLARMARAFRHMRPGASKFEAFLHSSAYGGERPLTAFFEPEGERLMRGAMRLITWQLLAIASAVVLIFVETRG